MDEYRLPAEAMLDMGDFAGAVLKYIKRHPIPRLTIAGGFAKMSKLAAGHMDLHSGRSQVDAAFLADLARSAGANPALAASISASRTGLSALQMCQAEGVPLGDAVAIAARDAALVVLHGAPITVDTICIDRAGVIVGRSQPAGPTGPTRHHSAAR